MKHFLNTRVSGFRYLLPAFLALALNGCGFMTSAPQPTMHTFLLDGEMPFVSEREGKGILLVNVPRANAGFSTPRMAYSVRQHELNGLVLEDRLAKRFPLFGIRKRLLQCSATQPDRHPRDRDPATLQHLHRINESTV